VTDFGNVNHRLSESDEQGAVVEASDGESAEDLADAVEEAGYGASVVD